MIETLLQVGASATAIIAAFLVMRPTSVPTIPHDGPSVVDVPELHILTNTVALYKLAKPNQKAAYFAILSALLSGAMPLWLLVKLIL